MSAMGQLSSAQDDQRVRFAADIGRQSAAYPLSVSTTGGTDKGQIRSEVELFAMVLRYLRCSE